jgi:DnaJ-class molecular chaperone
LGGEAPKRKEAKGHDRRLNREARALAILDLRPPVNLEEVKARYKALVKKLHPDANGGDKSAEERLKVVNQAYSTLKAAALD